MLFSQFDSNWYDSSSNIAFIPEMRSPIRNTAPLALAFALALVDGSSDERSIEDRGNRLWGMKHIHMWPAGSFGYSRANGVYALPNVHLILLAPDGCHGVEHIYDTRQLYKALGLCSSGYCSSCASPSPSTRAAHAKAQMFFRSLLPRAIVFHAHFAFTPVRAFSAMAPIPVQNFTLDRNIFNNDLYARLRSFWFQDLPEDAVIPKFATMRRWYGMGSDEEKASMDAECNIHAGDALAAIGPEKLSLPPFQSHEAEARNASVLSAPLLAEVTRAQGKGEKEAAEVLLSLVLLLDQMPRNIFRDRETLPRVYDHYDRLSLSLLRSAMALSPSPLQYPPFARRPVYMMWNFMPLMHSENLPDHDIWDKTFSDLEKRLEGSDNEDYNTVLDGSKKAAQSHRDPLERFGRYPHRNEALGRKNTHEEEEFMKTADTFGVKQSSGKNEKAKDEL